MSESVPTVRPKALRKKARASKKSAGKKAFSRPRPARAVKRYSDADRAKILATAQREGLTGAEVSKRFGISTITYYLWRKKVGVKGRRGRPPKATGNGSRGDRVEAELRSAVKSQVERLLPRVIREEVARLVR